MRRGRRHKGFVAIRRHGKSGGRLTLKILERRARIRKYIDDGDISLSPHAKRILDL